jgi:hypothetical protein
VIYTYDDFLTQILALHEDVRCTTEVFQAVADRSMQPDAGGVVDFSIIRQQAKQVLAGLQENKQAETKLVLESINTDIGVGD